jgi:hypothetical protein
LSHHAASDPDLYVCPGEKEFRKPGRLFTSLRSDATKDGTIIYRAGKLDCEACVQAQMLPKRPCTQDRPLRS